MRNKDVNGGVVVTMGETTNAAVEKLSPLKKLTPEQEKMVEDILISRSLYDLRGCGDRQERGALPAI